jgi:histone-binding protein RBBP4
MDMRENAPIHRVEAHAQDINSVDFNSMSEFLLLTASNDKSAALWDIRNLSVKLHSFDQHANEVMAARWNPQIGNLFATFSADRRVLVWDASKLGCQQSALDAEDGPPELIVFSFNI